MKDSSEAFNAFIESVGNHNPGLLLRIGLRVPVPWISEYVELRDWYYSKPRWLRWLFFLERRELEILTRRQQQVYLETVLREGAANLE